MQEHVSHKVILSGACAAAAGAPAALVTGQIERSVIIYFSHPACRADITCFIDLYPVWLVFINCQSLEKMVQLLKIVVTLLFTHTPA